MNWNAFLASIGDRSGKNQDETVWIDRSLNRSPNARAQPDFDHYIAALLLYLQVFHLCRPPWRCLSCRK
jgi:hypothetical protein